MKVSLKLQPKTLLNGTAGSLSPTLDCPSNLIIEKHPNRRSRSNLRIRDYSVNAMPQDHCRTPSIRILVVEENEALSMGLERYLVSVGHLVSTADSVKAAVNCMKDGEFDLLLVDLQLRDGTGWDLLESLTTRNAVRAIAMSGWGNDSDLAKSETSGFMRHLVKPITPEELAEAIVQVMNHPQEPSKQARTKKRATARSKPKRKL